MALEEVAVAGAREKAQVLGVAAPGDREPCLTGKLADLLLVHLAERKAHARERLRRERREHIALVLGWIDRGPQQRDSA